MELYAALVNPGNYLIVEDTNVSGNPVFDPRFNRGPIEAVEEFLSGNSQFVRDPNCEKYLLTFNPGGFLLRRE